MPRPLAREAEADRLLQYFGADPLPQIMDVLNGQFTILHNRAQVLLALGGIIISTTGFTGRNVAGTGPWAQRLVIAGVVLVLLSAAVVCYGVLHLRYLSMQRGSVTREWLVTSLRYRDLKTKAYRVGVILMIFGLSAYVAAIVIMLCNPLSAPNFAPR